MTDHSKEKKNEPKTKPATEQDDSSDDESLPQKLGNVLVAVVKAIKNAGDDDSDSDDNSEPKPKPPKATSGKQKKKWQPVLQPKEDVFMRALGLGRGVDGTNPTPWLNRTNFQVRKVTDETIHGTEEGGTVQKYVREVTSVRSQQSAIKASIDVPKAPLTIGVDAEYSRTFTKTRKSVGIRVHNRTIGFWMDFDDVSDWKYRNPGEKPLEHKTEETPSGEVPEGAGNDSEKTKTKGGAKPGQDPPSKPRNMTPSGEVPEGAGNDSEKTKTKGGAKPGQDPPTKAKNETPSGGGSKDAGNDSKTEGGTQPGQDEDESVKYTFEERICKWILSQVGHPVEELDMTSSTGSKDGEPEKASENENGPIWYPSPIVEKFKEHFTKCKEDFHEVVDPRCLDFIKFFQITHYISAIQLGAVMYEALEEEEYKHKFGTGAGAAVEKVGTLDFSTNFDWKDKVKETAMSCIGVMEGNLQNLQKIQDIVVNREDEAVIGAQIQPISRLIRDPDLKLSLQRAITSYMDDAEDDKEGPFYITCNNDKIFLRVCDPDDKKPSENPNEVIGVEGPENASLFYIVPTYDTKHPHEFAIAYFSKERYPHVNPIPRYLDTPINVLGQHEGPLKMSFSATEHNCQLTLRSRLSPKFEAGDITPWIAERDAFYVQCSHRWFRWNGYLCVKLQRRRGYIERYITACVTSIKDHSEEKEIYMVFRLIRPRRLLDTSKNAGHAGHNSATSSGSPEATGNQCTPISTSTHSLCTQSEEKDTTK